MRKLSSYLTPTTAHAIGMSHARMNTLLSHPGKMTLEECYKLAAHHKIKPETIWIAAIKEYEKKKG